MEGIEGVGVEMESARTVVESKAAMPHVRVASLIVACMYMVCMLSVCTAVLLYSAADVYVFWIASIACMKDVLDDEDSDIPSEVANAT